MRRLVEINNSQGKFAARTFACGGGRNNAIICLKICNNRKLYVKIMKNDESLYLRSVNLLRPAARLFVPDMRKKAAQRLRRSIYDGK